MIRDAPVVFLSTVVALAAILGGAFYPGPRVVIGVLLALALGWAMTAMRGQLSTEEWLALGFVAWGVVAAVGEDVEHGGVEFGRAYQVELDVPGREFRSQALGQAGHRELGRTISRIAKGADQAAGGADVDDPAAAAEALRQQSAQLQQIGELLEADLPATPESREVRHLEFELTSPAQSPAGSDLPAAAEPASNPADAERVALFAYALYYVCEELGGQCLYLRQDISIPVRIVSDE